MLEFDHVYAYYRDPSHIVLHGISLVVETGTTLAVLGANGSGKSTLLKAIVRKASLSRGEIRWEGRILNGIASHQICREGIAYVAEGQRVWPNLTVDENLRLGAFGRRDRKAVGVDLQEVYALLPRISALSRRRAHALSGGERQMVALGRALMACPRCLLLDEPSLGLAPGMIDEIFEMITGAVKNRRLTAIVVEQNTIKALQVADQVLVMRQGKVALERPVCEVTWERDLEPLFFSNVE